MDTQLHWKFTELRINSKLIVKNLHNKSDKYAKFSAQLTQLIKCYEQLAPLCANYDYNQLKLNGLRSFLTIIDKFIHKLQQHSKKWSKFYAKQFADVLDILLKMAQIVESIALNNGSLTAPEITQQSLSVTQRQYASLVAMGNFWLTDDVQKGSTASAYLVPIAMGNFWALFNSCKSDLCPLTSSTCVLTAGCHSDQERAASVVQVQREQRRDDQNLQFS